MICCSKLTVPSRLQGINYLQHVDGAVLVGCKTRRPDKDNIVLRVALATGLTRSECKSLHQLQGQHVRLTAKEDYAYEHGDDDGGESEHGGFEEDD